MPRKITRRDFIIECSAYAGAVTMPARYVQLAEDLFHTQGKALLQAPANPSSIIYAEWLEGELQLNLNARSDEAPPEITWREYLEDYSPYDASPEGRRAFGEEWEIELEEFELDEDCPENYWLEDWCRSHSPNADAYTYLESLPLVDRNYDSPYEAIGGLTFIDGDGPGNDYRGVHAADLLSISMLQERLNQLDQLVGLVLDPRK